jgi:hypothetical protein
VTQSQGSKIVSNNDDQDCQAAEKSKTSESWRHKAQALKLSSKIIIERPAAETQNQRKLVTQSRGSKVRVILILVLTMIARLPKSA